MIGSLSWISSVSSLNDVGKKSSSHLSSSTRMLHWMDANGARKGPPQNSVSSNGEKQQQQDNIPVQPFFAPFLAFCLDDKACFFDSF